VIIGLFLIFAFSLPFLYITTPTDDDTTLRRLTLVYHFEEMTYNGSDWITVEETESLGFDVSLSNMRAVLESQYYYDFPLAVPVRLWDVHQTVTIGSFSAEITSSDNVNGHDVWLCEIESDDALSIISYDKVTGILVSSEWIETDFQRLVNLEEMTFEPPLISYIKQEGVLLAGIYAELAVIIWLIAGRLERAK
jgi:hypothetical protein